MFLIALLLFCFSISNSPSRIFVAIMLALVATLIGWCIRTAWKDDDDDDDDDDVWQNSLVVLRRTCGTLVGCVKEFNPFHTRRVPQDDRITLNSRLNEGGV